MLYRTNAQSRQIEEALRRYGRKYIVVGGFSFYQRAEVKDVLAYLKVLVSPQDSISLLRIINTPARGIGRTTIEQIEQYALAHELVAVDGARGDAGTACVPGARGSRARGVSPDDDRNWRREWNAAGGGNAAAPCSSAPGTARCSKKRTPRKRARGWRTWTNC